MARGTPSSTNGPASSSYGLDRLIEAAAQDPSREPRLLLALLEATLYAHAPITDPPERLRLVMFQSPDDHKFVIPVFTDHTKAEFAARGNVRIVKASGRKLLEITRGATIMINPNDMRCTLYPEEINTLLAGGSVPPIQECQLKDGQAGCYKLRRIPPALTQAMKKSLPEIPGINVAYVAGLKWRKADQPDSLLIALGGRADTADREVRAAATMLMLVTQQQGRPVDFVHFDSVRAKPDWIHFLGLKPVYRRRIDSPKRSCRYN